LTFKILGLKYKLSLITFKNYFKKIILMNKIGIIGLGIVGKILFAWLKKN
jgi:hypothetical protein